jgi:hypothetical protein
MASEATMTDIDIDVAQLLCDRWDRQARRLENCDDNQDPVNFMDGVVIGLDRARTELQGLIDTVRA